MKHFLNARTNLIHSSYIVFQNDKLNKKNYLLNRFNWVDLHKYRQEENLVPRVFTEYNYEDETGVKPQVFVFTRSYNDW